MKLLFACSLLAGCVLPTGCANHGDGVDTGDDAPDTDPPPPPPPVASGTYLVSSKIDVTAEAILPEPAEQLVVTLRDFSVHPAHTLIGLAEDAGVPAVAELRALLPDVLESKLEDWLDAEIAKARIDGVPVTMLAADAAALAETVLTQFELDSELRIDGAQATHRLTAIDLAPAGIAARLALDVEISAPAAVTSRAGALSIGDHRFGLAYGDYLWRATDAAIAAQYGAGIRAAIGTAVDCPHIAQTIANKCVLGVCVGHADLLDELCEAGLDEVVGIAHDKIADLRFDALHFAAGNARLIDRSGDGIADALADGVWTAEINAGFGLRPVPATFTGTR
jgi:hypothetical protein